MKMYGSGNKKSKGGQKSRGYGSGGREDLQYRRGGPVNEYGESDEEIEALVRGYRQKRRRRRRTALLVVLILAVCCVGAYSIFIRAPKINEEGLANTNPSDAPSGSGTSAPGDVPATPTTEPEEPTENYEDGGVGRKSYCYTFLVVGEDQVASNTDTIIVGMIDVKNHVINCVSIPRDTLVNVSWATKKVNSIYYNTDGVNGLLAGMKDIFGYTIDQYAVVDLEAFAKLVEAVGGVYYDVPLDMEYDDPVQDLHIHIAAGYQLLNGEDALKVVRWRQNNDKSGYADGDIGRIGTQQDFLMTAAKQMLTLGNVPNISTAAQIFEEYVDTSLTAGNIVWYGKEFLKVDSESIHFMTLPGNYALAIGKHNTSYVEIDMEKWLEMLNAYFNPYYEEITEDNLNLLFYNKNDGSLYSNTGTVAGGPYSYFGAY